MWRAASSAPSYIFTLQEITDLKVFPSEITRQKVGSLKNGEGGEVGLQMQNKCVGLGGLKKETQHVIKQSGGESRLREQSS